MHGLSLKCFIIYYSGLSAFVIFTVHLNSEPCIVLQQSNQNLYLFPKHGYADPIVRKL